MENSWHNRPTSNPHEAPDFRKRQIVTTLKEAESGVPLEELTRQHAFSKTICYRRKAKHDDWHMGTPKRLQELEENRRPKQMYAEWSVDHKALKDPVGKRAVAPRQRRALGEPAMAEQGASERRARRVEGTRAPGGNEPETIFWRKSAAICW